LEILGGVAGAIAVWRFGFTVEGALAAGFLLSLIALSAIDLETGLLPDRLTLPLVWVGLAGAALGFGPNAAQAILGAALGYVLLEGLNRLCVLTIGRDGFGGGDGKLAAAMGAWLGLSSLPLALFIAFATGAIYGLGVRLLISRKSGVRADDSNEIPFGPWLAVGAVVLMLWPGMAAMAADWLIYGTL
jgi:leader peptidase (prepilin peptidase)/N-methyltransferase